MPKFVIERELVGAGKLPKNELQAISQKSCAVLQSMGPRIQWLQSFVTDDNQGFIQHRIAFFFARHLREVFNEVAECCI